MASTYRVGAWVQYNILLSFRAMINEDDDPEEK